MPMFKPIEEKEATGKVKEIYEDIKKKRQILLEGALPSPLNPPIGCVFHTRCPDAISGKCDKVDPPKQTNNNGHEIICHIPIGELSKKSAVFGVKE